MSTACTSKRTAGVYGPEYCILNVAQAVSSLLGIALVYLGWSLLTRLLFLLAVSGRKRRSIYQFLN